MIFLICIFIIIFAFCLYSLKFKNNFTLRYTFGKKGSGKSTLMVKWMLKDLRNGWTVYTDMKEILIPGIHLINTLDLAVFAPEPKSSIYLDEVGLTLDNRKFKTFPDGLRDFFALQRHFRCKVTVASQSYDVDKKVRDRVDSMFLCTNIGNVIGIVRPIKRTVTLVEASANGESRIADNLRFGSLFSWRFTWLPRYHKYFDSFICPPRELIPSQLITSDLSGRSELRAIRKGFRKK